MPSISQSFQENPLSHFIDACAWFTESLVHAADFKAETFMRGKFIWPIKTDKFCLLEEGYNNRTADPHYQKKASINMHIMYIVYL